MADRVDDSIDARLRRSTRLRQPGEFQRCFTQGQRVNGRCFRLHVIASDQPRLGLAVSRKVDTRAVVRNRIKRVARESFRHARATLPAADCVLVAKRDAATAASAELRAELEQLWRRARALKLEHAAGTMRDAPLPRTPSRTP
jgi:ribonuclease P protein component